MPYAPEIRGAEGEQRSGRADESAGTLLAEAHSPIDLIARDRTTSEMYREETVADRGPQVRRQLVTPRSRPPRGSPPLPMRVIGADVTRLGVNAARASRRSNRYCPVVNDRGAVNAHVFIHAAQRTLAPEVDEEPALVQFQFGPELAAVELIVRAEAIRGGHRGAIQGPGARVELRGDRSVSSRPSSRSR